jgi:hypothetical protein
MVCLPLAKVPLRGIRSQDYSHPSMKRAENSCSRKAKVSIILSPDYDFSILLCYGKTVREEMTGTGKCDFHVSGIKELKYLYHIL